MANKKISQLTELTSLNKDNDILPIVDSSSNKTKKAKLKNLPLSDASKGQGLALTYLTTTSTSVFSGTTIPNGQDQGNSALKVIYIGSNITSISTNAFNYCSNVHSLKFAEGVTTISNGSFQYMGANKTTTTSFPSTLPSIGGGCFSSHKWNKGLRFNEGLTSIGAISFNYNSFYEDFSLPDSLTTIGSQSFYTCTTSSVNLNIGAGLTTIGSKTFAHGKFYFSVDPENQSFSAVDGVLYEGTSLRIGNVLTGDYTLPNDVLSISSFAFKNAQRGNLNLNTNNVTSISSRAFVYNSNLKSITMGSGVTGIGSSAFAYGGLTGINLYATTPPTLGSNAFRYCGVTDIHVPVGSSYGATFGGLTVIKDL